MAQPHPNQVAFREGVDYLFHSWTALKLAVDGEWGGHDSASKRDWFIDTIVDYFTENGKNIDPFDLEDILLQVMNDEFSILLEDGSEQHIAKILDQLFLECTQGRYDIVQTLRADAQKTSGAIKSSSGAGEDASSGDEESDEDEDGGAMDVDVGEGSSKPKKEKPEPEIDEDGFETVVSRRRR
ncbi:hypothetical protein BGW38_010285 [Lunasporangiospora selenospora]|uniref:Pre-rRNA-processing protein TSR2 n=1 Tax=Lunasporangiospora selenospora TaxID=979761 RepID=A0A9P6FWD5_9FUNG|nr:hypothetical protein BGW38_010285 [Lunasporangiospora selenospora]